MTELDDVNVLYDQLSESSQKKREELEALVKKKQEKFSGLLTESGALFLVAKELGTTVGENTPNENPIFSSCAIRDLKTGMKVEKITGKIVNDYPAKSFERMGKQGLVQNVIITDDSGSITWTLWNEDVKRFENEQVGKGSTIEIGPVVVKEKDSRLSVQFFSSDSYVKVIERAIVMAGSILEVKADQNDITIEAKLEKKFPTKTFSSNARTGQLTRFTLRDGEHSLTGVAWNDAALQVELIPTGSKIRIENAYTKSGLNGEIELHAGWTTHIKVLEKGTGVDTPLERVIVSIHPDETVLIRGQVKELDPLRTFFDACGKCSSKVNQMDGKVLCAKCGETTLVKKAIAKFVVADETGKMNCVAFGAEAEKVWQQNAQTLSEAGIETIEGIAKNRSGTIVRAEGKTVMNSYLGTLELRVNRVQF